MKAFSVNQVNQVYVVPDSASVLSTSNKTVDDLKAAAEGSVLVGSIDGAVYLSHKGKGGITRTDLIENVMWAKKTPAINDALLLPAYKISLADGKEVDDFKGQTLTLTMAFDGYIGISPDDSTYYKYGNVKVSSTMTESEFWAALAKNIALGMKGEPVQFLKVFVVDEQDTATEITASTSKSEIEALVSDSDKDLVNIVIKMTEPDWIPGLKQQRVMRPSFTFNAVDTGVGAEVWGKEELVPVSASEASADHNVAESTLVANGKVSADFEYFFHGERGDQYRMMGYPNVIITKYMVDPSKEYDFVQIHYAYVGSNEACQKSEKDVTFLVETGTHNISTALVSALGTAGITVTSVSAKDWVVATGGESN